MKNETLNKFSWRAIFVGIVLGGFGLSLRSSSDVLGWAFVAVGAALILTGIVMIGIRSTRKD